MDVRVSLRILHVRFNIITSYRIDMLGGLLILICFEIFYLILQYYQLKMTMKTYIYLFF
jgi:hypothetical protein